MSTPDRPQINRRQLLALLGSSAALGPMAQAAAASSGSVETPVRVGDRALALEFDAQMRSRVLALEGGEAVPLGEFEASETVTLADEVTLDAFTLVEHRHERIEDAAQGPGVRHTLRGLAPGGFEKTVRVAVWQRVPGLAMLTVSYRNFSGHDARIERWCAAAHRLSPGTGGADYWCFSGASYEDRRDWVQRATPGFTQRNFMGMNASDYGGGTPVADVWRRDVGLAVGHVEPRPQLLSLPIDVTAAGARVAVESDTARAWANGATVATPALFVAVHRGDHYSTLVRYRAAMAAQGVHAPAPDAACYEPIWCAWGYERDFNVAEILDTLPKARELGLVWAGLDDGWQTAEGDWYLDPRKFPRGDADMVAFVQAVKRAGMKPKLWLAPLAVDPGTDLLHDATDLLLLNEDGSVRNVTWWNSFYLCPAYPKTVERTVALVRKIMGEWGFEGLKLDGQHLNAVPPCYNPAHEHARPEESCERLQDFWRAVYDTARSINPHAVVELCPCGTGYAFHNLQAANQTVGSDPESSWQVRLKGKTLKALLGASAPYAGDHVELSDHGDDFASTLGVGAVVSTKFTLPAHPGPDAKLALTPEKEARWRRWIELYNRLRLPEKTYRGELYDIGFDRPEVHVVEHDGALYYAFYAKHWRGPVELRGLGGGRYALTDYYHGRVLGEATRAAPRLDVEFDDFLLLHATPIKGARA